jgi:hypothetical protein
LPRTRFLVASVSGALLIAISVAVVPATAAPGRAAAACSITPSSIGETGDRLNVGVDAPGCGVVHGELYRRDASGHGPWNRVQEQDHRPGAQDHILFSFKNTVCGDYLAKFSSGDRSAQTPVLDRKPSDCS